MLRMIVAMLAIAGSLSVSAAMGKPVEDSRKSLVDGMNKFGFDFYAKLRASDGNIFFSPYSIDSALMMVYTGAAGDTAKELETALHLPTRDLIPEQINAGVAKITASLAGDPEKQGYELHVANGLWGQQGYPWLPKFLDTLAGSYAAKLNKVDYQNNPDPSRRQINDWVAQQTHDKIKDLIPAGAITSSTRMVLANAIYMKASWTFPFKKESTGKQAFHLSADKSVDVDMMHQTAHFKYGESADWQAVELPYVGDELAMLVLLPRDGQKLAAMEQTLDADSLKKTLDSLQPTRVAIALPKFTIQQSLDLTQTLRLLKIELAFSGNADFSGMDGRRDLFISAAVHKVFVAVDEAGTEAAAATGMIMSAMGMPARESIVEFVADHPFVTVIYHRSTGVVLFIGRVANPAD